MRSRIVLVAALLVFGALSVAFPRLNDVETGRTPEYPDLKVRDYRASVETVTRAIRTAGGRLSGWDLQGAGSGPKGAEIRFIHTTLPRLKYDVTVRILQNGGRTRVSVRSQSEVGPWDFGQNARNIREFLGALDGEVS
jgi:hypothetical protein